MYQGKYLAKTKPAKAPRKRKAEGERASGKTSTKRRKAAEAIPEGAEIPAEAVEPAPLPTEATEADPIREAKPRTRKPRAKKIAEPAEATETVQVADTVTEEPAAEEQVTAE